MTPEQKVAALQALFPKAGITHGYIGNCGVDSRGPFDDRSWRIFTTISTWHDFYGRQSFNVSIPGRDFDLDKVAAQIAQQVAS